jgi:hypothetical protein
MSKASLHQTATNYRQQQNIMRADGASTGMAQSPVHPA